MKKTFSTAWVSSKKPSKQRKYRFNAPLHIKQKFVHSHLSPELRKKYGKRAVGVRKGDKVKIMRGQFKGLIGKVDRIDLKRSKVNVSKAEMSKKDGTKTMYPIDPSNLMITELILDDKRRAKKWLKNTSKE